MAVPKQYLRWVIPAGSGAVFLLIVSAIVLFQEIPGSSDDAVKILFMLDAPDARSVSIVGDFNKWNADVHPLQKVQDIWKIEIYLKKGTYLYNFVIDGDKWITDPSQVATVDGNFGGKNSVIEIY